MSSSLTTPSMTEAFQPPPADVYDNDLIEQARAGSHAAFAQLVRDNQRLVRAILSRYFRDDNEVDELAQQVFVTAFRSLDRFRGESSLGTWLGSIARRQAAMYIRGELRRRNREFNAGETAWADWQDQQLGAEDSDPSLKLDALAACLEQLPAKSRELVQRFYFDRQPVASIAAHRKSSRGAVRMLLLRIRQVLGKCVSQRIRHSEGLS